MNPVPEIRACRSCGAKIIWTKTTRGAHMPVDVEPSPRGNLALTRDGDTVYSYGTTDADLASKRPLYLSHFATCPQRELWREK